ncbi:alpha/beta hydrolase [Butyrivibrio sp. AE2032]|uniref:alpha/beta hydrolase n=1 Tax=Butyrivibrio sp. AE2032 TaxID=1458463 RepID=UPI0006918A63|nr:alpha/beta fold hydrolase [Butyrivibrio sp. AE2032]
MPWIITVSAIVLFLLVSVVIFSWRNAKLSLKPRTMTLEKEMAWNKERGLWLDFDSYDKTEYEIRGKDGYILHAMFVENDVTRGTGKYVIICHGHTSCRYGAVKYVNSYIKLGFSCIIYDARTHGLNEKTIYTLGNYESEDLKYVIEDTRDRYKDLKILGLHGESMGSSTVCSVVRFDPKIDFIVADCGFTRCYDVVYDGYRRLHMAFIVPCINLASKLIYHVDMKETCAVEHLKKNKNIPILFIHGTADSLILPYHSEKLKEAASMNGAYTELIYVEGAGHAMSRYTAGFEKYTGYIRDFLSKTGFIA